MPCQPWDEKVTLTLADGVPLEVHKVPGSNVAWQNILKRIYPSAPSAIKALTPGSALSRGVRAQRMYQHVLHCKQVAHAYDLKCVMEDCALNAKAFTYTLEDGCDNDAFKWIELAGRVPLAILNRMPRQSQEVTDPQDPHQLPQRSSETPKQHWSLIAPNSGTAA
eukprot:scaffold60298_cov21-Tisochrysis_lutea.AAC.1